MGKQLLPMAKQPGLLSKQTLLPGKQLLLPGKQPGPTAQQPALNNKQLSRQQKRLRSRIRSACLPALPLLALALSAPRGRRPAPLNRWPWACSRALPRALTATSSCDRYPAMNHIQL